MKFRGRIYFYQKAKVKAKADSVIGDTIWDHGRDVGIDLPNTCDGKGTCGKCVVRIEEGAGGLAEKTKIEEGFSLGTNERLACQAVVISDAGDIHVHIQKAGDYTVLIDSIEAEVPLDPSVFVDEGRVFHRQCPEKQLGKYEGELLGLAIDVGTTTLVVQLIDLEHGSQVAVSASKNPQAAYGDDVVTRIGYTDEHADGLNHLQSVVIGAVNGLPGTIEEVVGRRVADHIYEVVVVGNPVMRNLFFGLSVHSLGRSPFEPDETSHVYRSAVDLGLEICPAARIYGAPLVAGQVGADCLADILVCDLHTRENPCMMVDIGTNGEVALGNRERIIAASNAAGSAFEGATVGCGVGAIEGAIKNIRISSGDVTWETIGDMAPLGICGSGLIDALAQMLENGVIDENGKFSEPWRETKVFDIVKGSRKLGITARDINELRLARAGLVLNQKTLLRRFGIGLDELESIFLIGGFGHYVNVENATGIGILPERTECIRKIGNGALAGARQMLLSQERRREGERLASEIEHVQLFEEDNLLDLYVDELSLRSWT